MRENNNQMNTSMDNLAHLLKTVASRSSLTVARLVNFSRYGNDKYIFLKFKLKLCSDSTTA